MLKSKFNCLIPTGLLMLAGGLLLHSFMHEGYSEFAGGLLIGMSLVFLIAGVVGSQRLTRSTVFSCECLGGLGPVFQLQVPHSVKDAVMSN